MQQDASIPIVSVLIPAFNASSFLERAVSSVLNQTFRSNEVIVVDDASSDNTLELAEQLAREHPNVRVVALRENGGPSVARNAAIEAARGEWLAILDADDAYEIDHLECLLLVAKQFSADIVLSNFCYFDPVAEKKGTEGVPQDKLPHLINQYDYVANARPFLGHQDWGLLKPMLKRSFAISHSISYPTTSKHGEDFLMMLDCFLAGAAVVISSKATYLYTHRAHGWSRTAVNYPAMAAQSAALSRDPRIAGDTKMMHLLSSRISSLERLAGEYEGKVLLNNRSFVTLLIRMITDPLVARAVTVLVLKKVRGFFSGT